MVTPSVALPEPVEAESPEPGGGVMVDVRKRFQTPLQVRMGSDGKPVLRHGDLASAPRSDYRASVEYAMPIWLTPPIRRWHSQSRRSFLRLHDSVLGIGVRIEAPTYENLYRAEWLHPKLTEVAEVASTG